MDDLVFNENSYIDSENSVLKEISPYDIAYPANFLSNGIKNRLALAQNAANEIYKAVVKEAPILTQVQ